MSDKPVRVLVAERHQSARTALRTALEAEGIEVVAECRTAADALEAAARRRPDVCLLDVLLAGGGLAAAEGIKATGPRIVMLGSSAEESELYPALRLGASGYLLRGVRRERLAADVKAVASGNAALAPEVAARLLADLRSSARGKARGLTARERQVLGLLADGSSTEQIARRLALPRATVVRHVSSAINRLAGDLPLSDGLLWSSLEKGTACP